MVFGKPLRSCEILKIWSQHHGIEQFWRFMKSNLKLSSMSLQGRAGAYAALGASRSTGRTFHQIQLEVSSQREMLFTIIEHFHELDTEEY